MFGLYNQITYVHVPPYELASSFADDRRFVSEIDRRLPEGAAVFQLPHLPFPEGGQQAGLFENDLLRGYLHSDDLRWSFGATKGRPEEWVDDLAGLPTATVLDAAAAAGFAGLYIDRFGYQDGGACARKRGARPVGAEPTRQRVGPTLVLRPQGVRRRLEAAHSPEQLAAFRQAVLEPFGFEESGFLPLERSSANGLWFAWADAPDAELRIVNPSDATENRPVRGSLDRVGGPPAEVVVTFPGAAPTPYRTPSPLQRQLTLPPGETVLRFATAAPRFPRTPERPAPALLPAGQDASHSTRRSAPSFPARERRRPVPAPPPSGGRSREATAPPGPPPCSPRARLPGARLRRPAAR